MRRIALAELAAVDAASPVPFLLHLGSETWSCIELLRVLPGRRIVLRARLATAEGADEQATERILKLFIGHRHAHYRERERRGLGWLREAGLPVPELLEDVNDSGVSGLIIEYLAGATVIPPELQSAVEDAAGLLGRMHEAGLWQADLHLKNFVLSDRGLYAVDGDGVRRRANPVPTGRGLEDLALLAAQRPPREDDGAQGVLAAYAGARSLALPDIGEFLGKLDHARRGRVKRYLKKCFRACTEFAVREDDGFRYFVLRNQGEAVLEMLLENGAFVPGVEFLAMEAVKQGNSATLVRTTAGSTVVIKRYNIKNLSQGIRRLVRPLPRYRRAWMAGQLLGFLDLPTARPLALVEEKRSLLPGVAYLVMEDLGSHDLAAEVSLRGCSSLLADEVADLFVLMKRAGLTHGDTKASNFLISDGRVHLIDLDAMRLGLAGFERDLERFLTNWQGETRLGFEAAFKRAGLLI